MKFENINYYLDNEFWNINEVVEENNIIKFIKVRDYRIFDDRYIIFDINTGNIIYNEISSNSNYSEAYIAYNAIETFIINMKQKNNE